MKRYKNMPRKKVYFTGLKINQSTDKMFKVMKEAFGGNFVETERTLPKNFFDTMSTTMTASLEDSILSMEKEAERNSMVSKAKLPALAEIEEFAELETLHFDADYSTTTCPPLPAEISREYWENVHSQFRDIKNTTKVSIETVPFSEGKTSYAFKIRDKRRKMDMAGKIDKREFNSGASDDGLETAKQRLVSQRYSL